MGKRFYRQVFVVEVLTDDAPLIHGVDLAEIHQASTTGDASVMITGGEPVELSRDEMRAAALAQGSDPAFFGIADEEDET